MTGKHSIRDRILTGVFAAISLAGAAGCGGPQVEKMFLGISPASGPATREYYVARSEAEKLCTDPFCGEDRFSLIENSILPRLHSAIDNSNRPSASGQGACPVLFLSKRADTWLDPAIIERYGEAAAFAEAEKDYTFATEAEYNWVPAWLGLAEIALHRGNTANAMSYLNNARIAIENLRSVHEHPDPPAMPSIPEALGLLPRQPQPESGNAYRLGILTVFLQESEAWDVDRPPCGSPEDILQESAAPDTEFVIKRLSARYDLLRLMIDEAAGVVPSEDAAIARLRQIDKDYFWARRALARRHVARGDYAQADKALRPWLEGRVGKLGQSVWANMELADLYASWYLADEDTPGLDSSAMRIYAMIIRHWPRYGPAFLAQGTLYLARWKRTHDPLIAEDFRKWMENEVLPFGPNQFLCVDPREVQELIHRYEALPITSN